MSHNLLDIIIFFLLIANNKFPIKKKETWSRLIVTAYFFTWLNTGNLNFFLTIWSTFERLDFIWLPYLCRYFYLPTEWAKLLKWRSPPLSIVLDCAEKQQNCFLELPLSFFSVLEATGSLLSWIILAVE